MGDSWSFRSRVMKSIDKTMFSVDEAVVVIAMSDGGGFYCLVFVFSV